MTPAQQQLARREYLRELRKFKLGEKIMLATTRFTNKTWGENQAFRDRNPNVKCAYSAPQPMSPNIPSDAPVFVLEMNNDTNRIMGIGLVRNRAIYGKYAIYQWGNYNRFVYLGGKRIDVSEMTKAEREMMRLFEAICFRGGRHMKRGHGITSFPISILYELSSEVHLTNYIRDMFRFTRG